MGRGAIQRELNKLVACGLLLVSPQGNQKHYQANKQSPIFNELKSIVIKTFGLAGVLSHALEQMSERIEFAFVYGSIAKGDEHAASDIDLLLVGEEISYSETMDLLEQPEQQLGRTINPTILTLSELKKRIEARQNFIMQVIKQPKIWLFGESQFNAIIESLDIE